MLNLDGRTTALKREERMLEMKAGYSAETKLVFAQQGHQSISRRASDLVISIVEEKHSHYQRHGNDLIYTVSMALHEALSCQSVEVRTLDNRTLRVSIDEIVR